MDILNQNNLECLDTSILKQSNILYAEDSSNQKGEVHSVLKEYFKEVFLANNTDEAKTLYEKNKSTIDILLIDIEDSIDFIKIVREENFDLPILLVTDFKNPEFSLKVIKYNISDYIAKPILINTTIKIINRILTNLHNQKFILKQKDELQAYKDIVDQENLISETDKEGIITYANDIFCEISGYSKEELLGAPHSIIRHPDTPAKVFEDMWATIQNKQTWRGKLRNRSKEGNDYYVKATIFPILDEDGEIEKYVASRYLVTEEEEEKHKLKKYILQQKSHQIKHEKKLQEEFDDAVHLAKMEKDKQVAKFFTGLNDQIKMLRAKNADEKGRILSLEKSLKTSMTRSEDMQKNYQERIEKLYHSATTANAEYTKMKKKYDIIIEKFEKSQDGIKVLQGYIDEYRQRIDELEDVVKSYEEGKNPTK